MTLRRACDEQTPAELVTNSILSNSRNIPIIRPGVLLHPGFFLFTAHRLKF